MSIGIGIGNFSAADGATGGKKLAECAAEFSPSGGLALQNAVRFDGINDFLQRGANLTGLVDGRNFTVSFWFKHTGKDNDVVAMFFHGNANRFRVSRLSKKWHFQCQNSAGTDLWEAQTVNLYDSDTNNPGWHHFIISMELDATPIGQMYVDDVVDQSDVVAPVDGIINFPFTEWGVGAVGNGGSKIDAEIAELWFDAAFLDLTVVANRRKFITASGKPVIMGSDGSVPTGAVPLVYLSGPTVSWHTNKGDGGGFTENGALVDATSNPGE